MKKLVALFIIVAAFLSLNNSTFSQPKFTLQLHGGYSLPMSQLKGELPADSLAVYNWALDNDADYNTYYMKTGFNFGLTGKYAFGKKGAVRLTFGGDYSMFNNSAEITYSTAILKIEPKMNIVTLRIGGEYAVIGKSKFTPYFGLDLTTNIIGGEQVVTYTPTAGTGYDSTYKLASSTRFGIGLGAGFEYAFSKQVGINFGVKYNMMNLIGKDADTTIAPYSSFEQPLNDKEYTQGNKTYSAKNIGDLAVSLGVSFYFGQPKKTVKK